MGFFAWTADKFGQVGLRKINLVTIVVTLILTSGALAVVEYFILRSSFLEELNVQVKIIGDNASAALLFNDQSAAAEILNTLNASPSIDVAALYTLEGKVLVEYRRKGVTTDSAPLFAPSLQSQRVTPTYAELSRFISLRDNYVGTIFMRANLRQLYIHLLWYIGTTVLVLFFIAGAATLLLRRMRKAIMHAEERLGYLSYHDTITHLPNRHAFNEHFGAKLEEAHQRGGKIALLVLDLDDFKVVNNTLGHLIGDKLLQAVAERLLTCTRQGDVVYRVGGDEFAMMMADENPLEGSVAVAEKFIRALMLPFDIENQNLYVGASVGISMFPGDGKDAPTLLRNADAAMYFAKARGKNNYQLFSGEMHEETMYRLALEGDLRNALERREFELRYQPIIELSTGRIIAAEALLRWRHPQKGLISPENFIPLAEETGLIISIGNWALRTACMDAQVWQTINKDMQVSVNLSGRQFQEEQLIPTIISILEETGFDPRLLMLEITESVLMKHAEATISSLRQLREMGISLSIDDFGTGYSSMTYLKRFPVSKLKIDQSFIQDIPDDSDDVAIVMATTRMAHGLKLEVVAEGVETLEQAEFLYENGCDFAQGFLFSRPIKQHVLLEVCKKAQREIPNEWRKTLASK